MSSLKHEDGWLDPEGKFYPLPAPYLHCEWCIQNGYETCQETVWESGGCCLDLRGWIKLTKGQWIILDPFKMTQRQYNFIFDWHIQNNKDLSGFRQITDGIQDTPLI